MKKENEKMKRLIRLAAFAAVALVCAGTYANESRKSGDDSDTRIWLPIGLSILTPPVQLPSPAHSVFGAMVNLGYGQVTDLTVLDVGIVNNVTRNMIGLEIGPVNIADTCFGAQVGAINTAGTVCGVQIGAINMTRNLHGVQLGLVNMSANGGALIFPIFNLGF
jgi:hypothetical protein